MLHFIYSCFDMIGPYGIILSCYLKRFSLFLQVFLFNYVHIFSCEMSLVSRLKRL